MTYRAVLFLCKVLLVVDILITSMAVGARFITALIARYQAILQVPVIGYILSFVKDPPWSEEVVLTCMSYMAVLSAALAIRRGAHIRMTAFDRYLPPKLVKGLDIIADLAVLALAVIMITVGWKYATGIGLKGTYVSMPKVSRFWMYFPVPLAGVAMLVFEVESLYNHVKSFFVREGNK